MSAFLSKQDLLLTRRADRTGGESGLHVSLVPVGILLGLLGTLLDSLVGATCQYTGYSPKLGKACLPPSARRNLKCVGDMHPLCSKLS